MPNQTPAPLHTICVLHTVDRGDVSMISLHKSRADAMGTLRANSDYVDEAKEAAEIDGADITDDDDFIEALQSSGKFAVDLDELDVPDWLVEGIEDALDAGLKSDRFDGFTRRAAIRIVRDLFGRRDWRQA
jgi:hypothetical protein